MIRSSRASGRKRSAQQNANKPLSASPISTASRSRFMMLGCARSSRNRGELRANARCYCLSNQSDRCQHGNAANRTPTYGLFAGDGFTIVVLDSFFSVGFVTLVSFFSHAANNPTVRARQMYFFMPDYRLCCQVRLYVTTAPRAHG